MLAYTMWEYPLQRDIQSLEFAHKRQIFIYYNFLSNSAISPNET